MTTDAIRSTAFELSRISAALSEIEILSHRKLTPGRARRIWELQGSLCAWDALDLRLAAAIGVDLCAVRDQGLKQLAEVIDRAYAMTMEGAAK